MGIDYAALKKGGFMKQSQKNYFSLRVKVIGGNLDSAHIAAIAKISEEYGKGYVHLTSRQSVEIPFIHIDQVEIVKEKLAKAGLMPSVCGARVRTVTACQGTDLCPAGCIPTYQIAKELDRRYFGLELPHKFKLGVTGCKNNCLKAEENDVGIKGGMEVTWEQNACIFCGICERVCRDKALTIEADQIILDKEKCSHCGRCVKSCPTDAWKGEPGFLISFGGTFGNQINQGVYFLPLIKEEAVLYQVIDQAIDFFRQHGRDGERFVKTLEREGMDRFQTVMEEAYQDAVRSES